MVDNPGFPPLGGGVTRPPDTGTTAGIPLSYADKLKTNIKWDNRFKRNVLEIILDNDNKKFVNIPDNVIDRLFKTLGNYIKSQVEGFFRPSGKRDVTVKVSGLEFNTPDLFVIEYLCKFGKVVKDSVIYDKYREGPFAGNYNGDRKFSVHFTQNGTNMGTFHIIDGVRVKIFYNGNKKTCAQCHQTADVCKGVTVASECETLGVY